MGNDMAGIPAEFLSCFVLYDKIIMLFGETGARPVRARRRKAKDNIRLTRLPQSGDMSLAQAEKAV